MLAPAPMIAALTTRAVAAWDRVKGMRDAIARSLRRARGVRTLVAVTLVIQLLHADAEPPRRATAGSAGYDLCAYLRGRSVRCSDGTRAWEAAVEPEAAFALPSGVSALIPLGFKAQLPRGIEAQIRPRSGTTFKKGLQIPNAPGTIDSDFPDEWMVIVRNPTAAPILIEHGERIAQMVLARYEALAIESGEVGVTTDRIGGFGSTHAR
jgi:dUTP pyrophosphatase